MVFSTNTPRLLSAGITILFCCGYVIYFFSVFKRKYDLNLNNMLQEDKKRLMWLKSRSKLFIEKISTFWKIRFLPGLGQNPEPAWSKGARLGYFLEIGIIFIWAIFVGRAFLNMDPLFWPYGREFPSAIQSQYIWSNLFKCGACVFWNGFSHGGAPAFADMLGSMLYPFVIFFTLMVGPLGGAKLTLIASLIMAGCAQWWLAKVMGFGRIARLWGGLFAVVAGNLAASMESGDSGVLFSAVACSLVLAPGVALGLTGKRRYSILLGITIGLAFLSGQGYMQVGLTLSIIPAFLLFLPRREPSFKHLWKEYLLAGFLAFLIAGIFFLPMIHFFPNVAKSEDSSFGIAQPLKYIPLNQLIDDVSFFYSSELKQYPFPTLYATFLGWIPILLAVLAWRFIPKSRFRLLLFFLVSILLIFLIASADLLRLLMLFFPFARYVRNPPIIAGLANPLILGLSAWGLDALLQIKLPKLAIINPGRTSYLSMAKMALLILAIPLIWSLREAYVFGQHWLTTVKMDRALYQDVAYLKTNSSEWINLPFGDQYWLILGFDTNLKISNGFRNWTWMNRPDPPVNLEATRTVVDPPTPNLVRVVEGLYYLSYFENEYAYIQSGDQKIPCKAQAIGGNIDVACPGSPKGQLIVYENNWTGWRAWVDQTPASLLPSDWLSTDAPAGQHNYHFRYRPWDVWAGIFLTCLGIVLSIILWIRARKATLSSVETPPAQA